MFNGNRLNQFLVLLLKALGVCLLSILLPEVTSQLPPFEGSQPTQTQAETVERRQVDLDDLSRNMSLTDVRALFGQPGVKLAETQATTTYRWTSRDGSGVICDFNHNNRLISFRRLDEPKSEEFE